MDVTEVSQLVLAVCNVVLSDLIILQHFLVLSSAQLKMYAGYQDLKDETCGVVANKQRFYLLHFV